MNPLVTTMPNSTNRDVNSTFSLTVPSPHYYARNDRSERKWPKTGRPWWKDAPLSPHVHEVCQHLVTEDDCYSKRKSDGRSGAVISDSEHRSEQAKNQRSQRDGNFVPIPKLEVSDLLWALV